MNYNIDYIQSVSFDTVYALIRRNIKQLKNIQPKDIIFHKYVFSKYRGLYQLISFLLTTWDGDNLNSDDSPSSRYALMLRLLSTSPVLKTGMINYNDHILTYTYYDYSNVTIELDGEEIFNAYEEHLIFDAIQKRKELLVAEKELIETSRIQILRSEFNKE